jgi:hypothetical protein
MQVHFIGRHVILEELHGATHGDLNIQTAADPHGRAAEEGVFIVIHDSPPMHS